MLTNNSTNSHQFVGKSLLNHAREIYRYAKSYCEQSESNTYITRENRDKFSRHLNRMISEMYLLMNMANDKGVSFYCNKEQIDAYIEAAEKTLAARPVFDAASLHN